MILYTISLEGYAFRLLKELSAYDISMPILVADKLSESFVRSDVVITPALHKYLISRMEAVDTTHLLPSHKSSVQRLLLKLYNIKFD